MKTMRKIQGLDYSKIAAFPRDYLLTFYAQGPTPDEEAVFDFLVRHYPKIGAQPCIIEIGCGPAIHHVLPAAPFVSEVHMADYLSENLEQIQAWKEGRPDAHNWHLFTALTLRLEGRPAGETEVVRRERDLRDKITSLLRCDLTRDSPLGFRRQYPVVGCFYCTEVIGGTETGGAPKEEWRKIMCRLATLVAPGGYLFLSALKESRFYVVRSPGGKVRRLPVTLLMERDFHEILPTLGFDMADTVIESKDFTGQEEEGLTGIILVAGRKGG